MASSIGIIGGGAWGTAVGKVLADAGNQVALWVFEEDVVRDINEHQENKRYLAGVKLPAGFSASTDIRAVADGKDFIIFATPSLYTASAVKAIMTVPGIMEGEIPIGVLTKGFVQTSKGPRMMLQAMEDYLPGSYRDNLVYISGPSHAEEVGRGKLTGLIAASRNPMNSVRFKHLLNTPPLMVYSSLDVVGVQVAAAVKNVVAIAFGMLDAIKDSTDFVGDNTESLLLAAGLNEIQTLAVALGCTHPETISSIAGVGDLDVTCRSVHGRNRRFGKDVVEKKALDLFTDIGDLQKNFQRLGYLPEGAVAVSFVVDYIRQFNLRMPLCAGVYRILNKEITPQDQMRQFLQGLHNPGVSV